MEDIQKSYEHERIKRTAEIIKIVRIAMLVMNSEELVDQLKNKGDITVILKTVDRFLDLLHRHIHPLTEWIDELNVIIYDRDFLAGLTQETKKMAVLLKNIEKYYNKSAKAMTAKGQLPQKKNHPLEKLFKEEMKRLMKSLKVLESMTQLFRYFYSDQPFGDSNLVVESLGRISALTAFHSLTSEMYDFVGDLQELFNSPKLLKALFKIDGFEEAYIWISEDADEMIKGVEILNMLSSTPEGRDILNSKNPSLLSNHLDKTFFNTTSSSSR